MNRGFVLLYSIILLSIITSLAVRYATLHQSQYRIAVLNLERTRCLHAARSGLEFTRSILEKDLNPVDGIPYIKNASQKIRIDDIPVTITVIDEQGKINLNRLVYPSGDASPRLMNVFLRWSHSDTLSSETCVSKYKQWFEAFHTPFLTPTVGRLASGINEKDASASLTVFGNGLININTANDAVLKALLEDNSGRLSQKIISFREKTPFTSPFDLKDLLSSEDILFQRIFPLICVNSTCFTISALAGSSSTSVKAEAIIQRSSDSSIILRYRDGWS
jgi:type II secretory pathway component PulK